DQPVMARELRLGILRCLVKAILKNLVVPSISVVQSEKGGHLMRKVFDLAADRLKGPGHNRIGLAEDLAECLGALRARLHVPAVTLAIAGKGIIEFVAIKSRDGRPAKADDEKKEAHKAIKGERYGEQPSDRFTLLHSLLF